MFDGFIKFEKNGNYKGIVDIFNSTISNDPSKDKIEYLETIKGYRIQNLINPNARKILKVMINNVRLLILRRSDDIENPKENK